MYVFRQDLRNMDLDKNTQEYITTKYPISLMLNLDFKIFLKQFHTGSCILWTDKNIHRLNDLSWWNFEAATLEVCNCSKKFGSLPRKGKVWKTVPKLWFIWLCYISFSNTYDRRILATVEKQSWWFFFALIGQSG